MTDWLVREHARGVMVDAPKNSVTIWAKSKPRFRENDRMLLASGYGETLTFNRVGKIISIDRLEKQELDERVPIRANVENWVQLPEETTLGLMQFSLTFVRNLERPNVHFRRTYRKLPEADTQTLAEGDPFVMRTAYYNFLYALPSEMQRTFIRELEDTSARARDRTRLDERLSMLLGLVERRILCVGRTLQQLDAVIAQFQELTDDRGSRVTHEFVPGSAEGEPGFGSQRGDEVSPQAGYFREFETFVRALGPSGELSVQDTTEQRVLGLMDSVRSLPAQRRFEEIFRYE